jgi:hypothetical protein
VGSPVFASHKKAALNFQGHLSNEKRANWGREERP